MARLMVTTPIIFSIDPALTMSMTLRLPKEKAMALGGVATGSIKARLEAKVQGIMTYIGWILIATAIEARMGRNSVVVAVLLEHSVKRATSKHSRIEMANGGMF